MRIEKISAVTLKVASMRNSVRFYGDVLGMEVLYRRGRCLFLFASRQGRQRAYP